MKPISFQTVAASNYLRWIQVPEKLMFIRVVVQLALVMASALLRTQAIFGRETMALKVAPVQEILPITASLNLRQMALLFLPMQAHLIDLTIHKTVAGPRVVSAGRKVLWQMLTATSGLPAVTVQLLLQVRLMSPFIVTEIQIIF